MRCSPSRAVRPPDAYHHGDLREALIDAAMREAVAGPERVSLRGIARALGVSQSAAYRHFDDRDHLLIAVATRVLRGLTVTLGEAAERSSSRSALARIGDAHLDFGLRNFGLYRLLYVTPPYGAAIDGELQAAARANFDLVLAFVAPGLDEASRRHLTFRFWAGLHGLVLAGQGPLAPMFHRVGASELVDGLVRDVKPASAVARNGRPRARRAWPRPDG